MQTVVERELELRLVLTKERSVAVNALLAYRTDDPYAVHITFHLSSDAPVNWTFSRELLIEGLTRPCGQGDVRVWAASAPGKSALCIALTSPDGEALLEAPTAPVTAWLEDTLRAVPPGEESQRLRIDEGLEALFSPASLKELQPRERSRQEDGPSDKG